MKTRASLEEEKLSRSVPEFVVLLQHLYDGGKQI